MPLQKVTLHKLKMRLKFPFRTSFGTIQDKEFFIIEAMDDKGNNGFGESVSFSSPWYTEETTATNEHVMKDFLIPLLKGRPINHPDDITETFRVIRGNNMAKAGIEGAIWDLYAKQRGETLATALGGIKKEIDVGVSLGIQPDINDLLADIDNHLKQGYKRIKLKIKPGQDLEILQEVRQHFPDTPIMADANSAYSLQDSDHLKKFDGLNLMMVEQPLAHDDRLDHAKLQKEIQTPICLDESIHSYDDARHAIELGSCKIINVKIGRVGGLTEAKRIHNLCQEKDVPVWCGGMLEAGVGRAHNIALTTLPNFTLPGDTAGSSRYWEKDIIKPEVEVQDGTITVPTNSGIGYEIDREALKSFRVGCYEYEVF
ncbi:o-succinylbenzoate synthase [Virgibacillus phasianinus]|uniref:o-succinylbenzoate synthase n=1 Tax=Virgibacillus phasianinus TaxID=2017483 RepID=A0A220U9G1_9BACI|nr:o-succinylbenzoate synthase [Virgibacillus phasianinus]